MIERSANFKAWFGWFSDTSQEPATYIDGCERVPGWLAEGNRDFLAFRDELATHIRESSYPPLPNSSQWTTDEWLRSIWYDVFGPDAPPGDPYPVDAEDWGRIRLTPYMLHAVDEDDEGGSDGAADWLARRGLTAAGVYNAPAGTMVNFRPEPADYAEHLRRATEAGLREDG